MSELERKVSTVRLRLKMFRILDWCLWALIGGLSGAALFLLVLKFVNHQLPTYEVAGGIVGIALVLAILGAVISRFTILDAAIKADETLNLRERLSSALLLSRSPLKEARAYGALEDDAREYARAIHPGRDFRYRVPGHAKHTIWPALAIVAIYFMPQYDLFSQPTPQPQGPMYKPPTMTETQRQERAERLRELAEEAKAKEEELAESGEDLQLAEKLERLSRDLSLGKKSEREMVAEMSRLSDEIKMREREITKKTQPYKQLQGLERSEYTQDLKKDLKDQNFDQAAQKLMEMADMMKDPSQMTPEQMQQMAKELEDLSKSLEENQEMSKALEQAAQALQQAAQQQPPQNQQANNQQQKQQNQANQSGQQEQNKSGQSGQKKQQQQQANQQGSQSASQGKQGQNKQQQQAAQNASAALQQAAAQMQDMQQMMQQAQALSEMQSSMSSAMSQSLAQSSSQSNPNNKQGGQKKAGNPNAKPGTCSSCNGSGCSTCNGTGRSLSNTAGTGQFSQGNNVSQGLGTGGPGRGRGGNPPDDGSMASGFDDVFIPGQQNEGEIIATFEIEASAPRGESTLRYTSVPQAYKQRAADAIVDQEIPAAMRNSVKDYFEKINFQDNEGE